MNKTMKLEFSKIIKNANLTYTMWLLSIFFCGFPQLMMAAEAEEKTVSSSQSTVPYMSQSTAVPSSLSDNATVPDEAIERYLGDGQGLDDPDEIGWTPLQRAAKNNDVDACLGLIQRGAEVNKARPNGHNALWIAAQLGNETAYNLLKEHGASAPDIEIEKGALTDAASTGNLVFCELLLDMCKDLEEPDEVIEEDVCEECKTPLYWAAEGGHARVCELLIERGAQVETCEYGQTPLLEAVESGYTETARVLLENGADPFHEGPWDMTDEYKSLNSILLSPQELRYKTDFKDVGYNAIFRAAEQGDKKMLQLLLQYAGDKLDNVFSADETPLMAAAEGNFTKVCKLLLRKGANINYADEDGITALMVAVHAETIAATKLLLKEGANPNKGDINGVTPLMIAIIADSLEGCEILLEKGADINQPDKKGKTPLMYAIELDDAEMSEWLISKGAGVRTCDNSGKSPLMLAAEKKNKYLQRVIKEKLAEETSQSTQPSTSAKRRKI